MFVSVHHYDLAPSATEAAFRETVAEAAERGLFDLPGLDHYRFLYGVKGARTGEFTAVWTYESRAAWTDLWGPPEDPVPKADYPERWRTWEEDLLAPLVVGDPDGVEYTSYEVVDGAGGA